MSKELQELRTAAVEADPLLTGILTELREASFAIESLGLLAGRLQREATDCEFEPIPPAVQVHLDGRLLQRTRYIASRVAETGKHLRNLALAVRTLQTDAAALVALVPEAPADPAAASEGAD